MPDESLRVTRDTILVTLGCLAAGVLAPAVPVVGVPLCALALAWLTYRVGVSYAVGVVMVTSVAAGALDGWLAMVMMVPTLLAAGPFAALALKKLSAWRVAGVVTLAGFAGTMLMLEADAALRGTNLIASMGAAAAEAANTTRGFLAAAGTGNTQGLADQLEAVRQAMFETWPSFYLLLAAVVGALSVIAVIWISNRLGQEVHRFPPLDGMDLSWHIVWPVAAGFALLAVSRYTAAPHGVAAIMGANIMLLARWALLVQGLGVFAGLYKKVGIGRFGRTLGFVALAFTESITPIGWPIGLVSLTGLIDLWANLRKLPRGRTEGAAAP